MGNLDNFDPKEHQTNSFEPLPPGEYVCMAIESDLKPTKSGEGEVIMYEFQILEGAHKGYTFRTWYNFKNPNEKAQNIGRGQLANFARACGKEKRIGDTSELHNIPIKVELRIKEGNGEYGPSNIIWKYMALKTNGISVPETKIEDDELPAWAK